MCQIFYACAEPTKGNFNFKASLRRFGTYSTVWYTNFLLYFVI